MYHQLGTTIFDGLFSYHDYERKVKGIYAELDLINSKPDAQRMGTALEVIDLSIRLHDSFCDPVFRYEELRAYCNNGDILPFLDGRGNVIGTFFIEELTQAVTQTDRLGAVTLCECKAVLKEFVSPDRVASRALAAKRSAFALSATSLTIKTTGPAPSLQVDVLNSMKPVNAGAQGTVNLVNQANTADATKPSYIAQAVKSANQLVTDVNALATKLQDYLIQGFAVDQGFKDGITALATNANSLATAIRNGDMANAVNNGNLVLSSTSQLNTIALPMQELMILR